MFPAPVCNDLRCLHGHHSLLSGYALTFTTVQPVKPTRVKLGKENCKVHQLQATGSHIPDQVASNQGAKSVQQCMLMEGGRMT